jgi:predicted phosphodiesterase
MRIAVISDIHGNLDALRAVLEDVRGRGCDAIADLGDIVSGPLWPAETAELLIHTPAFTIRGNHERQLLDPDLDAMGASDAYARRSLDAAQLEWIAALPATLRLGGDVLLCHGMPDSDMDYLLERVDDDGVRAAREDEVAAMLGSTDAQVVLCGHTHVPRAVRLRDGRWCVNPGSVGLQAFHADHPRPHTIQSGHPAARYAILTRDRADWRVDLLAVDYDPLPAARLAAQRGREDWAQALRSGRLSL